MERVLGDWLTDASICPRSEGGTRRALRLLLPGDQECPQSLHPAQDLLFDYFGFSQKYRPGWEVEDSQPAFFFERVPPRAV